MPRRNSLISRLRHGRAWDEWDEGGDAADGDAAKTAAARATAEKPRSRKRRATVALTFAVLFVAGAAFSAGAGNQVRTMLEGQAASDAASADEQTTTDAAAPAAPEDAAPAEAADDDTSVPPEVAPDASDAPAAASDSSAAVAAPTAPAVPAAAPVAQSAPVAAAAKTVVQRAAVRSGAVARAGHRVHRVRSRQASRRRTYARTMRAGAKHHAFPKRKRVRPAAPEFDGADASAATIWLNRALPDPTPPARRLSPRFAKHLASVSRHQHVSWALMLGVLRAEGHTGAAPANLAGLKGIAAQLRARGVSGANPWAAMFSLGHDTSFADRAVALSHYYRAVGLRALVRGLEAEKKNLGQRLLNDPRVSIYLGGRGDIQSGRVNVRVLALVAYLADSFGQVTVSCLISGHRLYARPGVISAHIYGLAADISELGGVSITGHQQAGSVTEHAVRDVLMLPPELMPKQVISLIGLGGPSFPLANHYDHIHIGY
jgi:hypothetical protein